MKEQLNLLEIANKAHSNAKRLGKLGNNRNAIEKLKDVQGEYMEALKALNDGNHVDWERFNDMMDRIGFSAAFTHCVKDTYEQELTDMFMVILTLMKDNEMDIVAHVNMGNEYNSLREVK